MRVALPALVIAAAAGCVERKPTPTGAAWTFETWIPAVLTLGAVVALLAAMAMLVKRRWKYGLIALVVGVVGLVAGPGMFFDKAVVDDEHVELRTGFWFAPTRHDVRWDDVRSLEGVAEEKTGRRGRKSTSFYFVFTKKTGGSEKVPLGDLMKRGPADKIVDVATRKGIPLSGVMPGVAE